MGGFRRAVIAAFAGLLLLPLSVTTAAAAGDGAQPRGSGPKVTVMTRNLYLGADIQRPLRATAGLSGPAALVALGNANHETRAIVDQTDFPTRSRLVAAEIASEKPDLVGLQEVALWRRGPLELLLPTGALDPNFGVPNATTVDQDFLQILLDRLAARGAYYVPVSVQVESDVEAPSFLGNPFLGTMSDASDVRLTMRDVILKRVDSKVHVTGSGSGNYTARLTVDVGGVPQVFVRGYNWVDARVGNRTFRLLNTHLEAFSSDLALFQASELLNGPAAGPGTTIIVCDCNSDPLNSSVKPTDPYNTPHNGPYNYIVGSGFTDQWLEWAPASAGWTSGLSETVNDPTAAGFDHRIDMVFAHGPDGQPLTVTDGAVVGNQLSDRDPATGLWPSDHAGVVLQLRIPTSD